MLVLWLSHSFWLRQIGKALIFSDSRPLSKSDVIIVLSGDGGSRVKTGAMLYKAGYAPRILMTGGPLFVSTYADYMADYAQSLGIPAKAIILERRAVSTYTNATDSLSVLESMDMKRVIVVTSKYHTRRSYAVFRSVFPPGVDIHIVAAPDEIDYDRWWTDSQMAEPILIEWAKRFFYLLNYGIW